tara:strand:- start:2003 stop:2410 length:408 start_codon:yes stop_codon:yes gene_type:complete
MKAALVLDQFADTSLLTDEQRTQIKFKPMGKGKFNAVFPAGTIFEGDDAIRMCKTGQAAPYDEECAKEVGMSEAKLKSLQLEYKMNTLGINNKNDRELYRAGVILGYDSKLEYLPGPNWNAYQDAKKETASEDDI